MNKRGPTKSALIFKESSDGWIYELFPSGDKYGIYLINPDGRRFENLSFYVEDGLIRHLDNGKMPSEFDDIFLDREDFADTFIQEAFKIARLHAVMES